MKISFKIAVDLDWIKAEKFTFLQERLGRSSYAELR
jgi:hypothetical protein